MPVLFTFFFLFMGFRTILDQSLFDIGKGSGFIPEVTRCGELNNCVSMCVHAGVCVSVHTHVCVCAAFLISECSSVELFIVHLVSCFVYASEL